MTKPQSLDEEILAPYTHLIQVRGKRFREKIVLAFNHWFKVPEDQVQKAVESMTILHNASLLIDDIQDDAMVRRGTPAAHCIYGIPLTVNASLQMIVMSFITALQLMPNGLVTEVFREQFMKIVRGQGIDIYYRNNLLCPTEEEYKQILEQKTGGMLLLGVKYLQIFSKNKKNYDEFVKFLGYYYQLRDDYCNLKQTEALEDWPESKHVQVNKDSNVYDDITEGKFSLPIIHAMKTAEGPKILNILRQHTLDMGLKKYCVSLLEKSGSLQYTREVLSECDRKARAELTRLGGNPLMEAVLDRLLSWKG